MALNLENYATTIIDNNDDVAEKTLTLFRNIGRNWNGNFQRTCGAVRLNNVRTGFISYDFKDFSMGYSIAGTTYTNGSLPSGLEVITYKNGSVIKTENVLVNNDFNKIMGNAVIYTFSHDEAVDKEIKFMFGHGVRTYQVGKRSTSCHCSCSKCSGGDPIYNSANLYDYIDLKITYNLSGVGEERFHRVEATFDEVEEVAGTHSFKREFDLGKIDFRMVDVGINENKAIDISFFDTKWNPNEQDIDPNIKDYKNGPCSRHRAVGTILREEVQHFRDHSKGELPETPYENVAVTKDNIKNSNIFKRVSASGGSGQMCNLNNYEILNFQERDKNTDVNLKVYLTLIGGVTKLIVEYVFNIPNVNGVGNDRLRFKSKIDIGLNFKLK